VVAVALAVAAGVAAVVAPVAAMELVVAVAERMFEAFNLWLLSTSS
jgi:hypothetical protein